MLSNVNNIIIVVILLTKINTNRCGNLLNQKMNTHSTFMNDVKMSSTRGQSAWVLSNSSLENKLQNPSETKRSAFNCGNTKFRATSKDYQWLVGVTDGDGTFYFAPTPKGGWTFCYKIGQSNYNLRLLYHIKNIVGVGSISVDDKNNASEFRVRNIKHICQYILPIFEKYPLLTSKYFNYTKFRDAILIFNESTLTIDEKNNFIFAIYIKTLPVIYISPAWYVVKTENKEQSIKHKAEVLSVMSKSWVVGFIEAEGSFYLVNKGPQRIVHAFEVTQKLDIIVLEAIGLIFRAKVTNKKTYNTLVIYNKEGISLVIDYFFNTMKGMKALEYRIWARSFNKQKKDFSYLSEIRNKMRNIRSIRLDKTFKIKK